MLSPANVEQSDGIRAKILGKEALSGPETISTGKILTMESNDSK